LNDDGRLVGAGKILERQCVETPDQGFRDRLLWITSTTSGEKSPGSTSRSTSTTSAFATEQYTSRR
jgi:hypothetical protein